MLKKAILVTGLVAGLMASSAWANDSGVTAGEGSSADRAQACSLAKNNASIMAQTNGEGSQIRVIDYSSCDCSKGSYSWTCTVDARWEKKR